MVQQSVALNTPGKRDGGFTLDVNGRRVIERHDVYYRDVTPPIPDPANKLQHKPKPKPKKPDGGLLGLGPLLGKLGLLGLQAELEPDPESTSLPTAAVPAYQAQQEWDIKIDASGQVISEGTEMASSPTVPAQQEWAIKIDTSGQVFSAGTEMVVGAPATATEPSSADPTHIDNPQPTGQKPVGFIGLFFRYVDTIESVE